MPPLESVHADVSFHSPGSGRLGRDGGGGSEPYGVYVYQQWAKSNPEAAANVHPSTAAALLTRAAKVSKSQ